MMWRRVRKVALLFLAILSVMSWLGAAVPPFGERNSWNTTSSSPWIALTTGCGFCSGNLEVPEVQAVILYESGEVLWVRYGSAESSRPNFTAAAAFEEYLPEVKRVFAEMDNYYLSGYGHEKQSVKIHHAATGKLNGVSMGLVRTHIGPDVAIADDPGEPKFDCEDCSAPFVEIFHKKHLTAELKGNYASLGEWNRILSQLQSIHHWIQPKEDREWYGWNWTGACRHVPPGLRSSPRIKPGD